LILIESLRQSMRGLTYDDIREKLGWETKTIERMLKLVETKYGDHFIRERGEDGKRYFRLRNANSLPLGDISENEIVAMKTVLGFIESNEPLRLPLESLTQKLAALKGEAGKNIEDLTIVNGTASAPRPRIRTDREIIEKLQEAILACRMVEMNYEKGGNIARLVRCPLGFLYGAQDNYLVAAHESYVEQPRHFYLSHISGVRITEKYFDAKNFNIHEYAKKSFGAWISPEGGYRVKWRVKPEAAERARRFIFHPTQKITPRKDGALIVEFFADGLKEMAWHLMTWEGNIQPIAPKELVAEYKSQLQLAAKALK